MQFVSDVAFGLREGSWQADVGGQRWGLRCGQ
jgi:hypothetical protein